MYSTALWAVAAVTMAPASTKMMKSVRSMSGSSRSLGRGRIARLRGLGIGRSERLIQRGMHDLALVGDHDPGHELVGQVDRELAILGHVGEQRADVARVHGRRRGR